MTRNLLQKISTCFLLLALSFPAVNGKEITIKSPDGLFNMLLTDQNSGLTFSIDWNGKPVILESQLGIQMQGEFYNRNWLNEMPIADVKSGTEDNTWTPVYGERATVRDHYNWYYVTIGNPENQNLALGLEIRAYNEGIAFRYEILGDKYIRIIDEHTNYTLPANTLAYYCRYAQTEYDKLPIVGWPDEAERPLTLELENGLFACLTEAQMINYVRSKFKLGNKPNTIYTSMYDPVDELAPYKTPWRVVMAADRAIDLLANNDLILNLNPPCEIADTEWIKPGKVMREMTLSTEGAKALVDFAVKRNLQYIHFDAGWYGHEYTKESDATFVSIDPLRNPDPNALDMQEAVRYANEHGIGVFVYVNQRALEQQLDEILPLYQSWGIAGIKFGFVHVGSQTWSRWMHEAVRKCAEYGLLVDIHDEYRPTGFSRTYPNLLTQEGIHGNEEFPTAKQNVIQPYTRFIAGAADYTICYYHQSWHASAQTQNHSGRPRYLRTTSAHQLALAAVYYSPLQFMYWYDKPEDSQEEPELEFFDNVKTVWDDTKILDGEAGEYITVARESFFEWFVGSITDRPRTITIDTDFLEGKYVVKIYEDDDTAGTRTKVGIRTQVVKKGDKLTFDLKEHGGVALHFVPVE